MPHIMDLKLKQYVGQTDNFEISSGTSLSIINTVKTVIKIKHAIKSTSYF
jgi:hypothetical protein